MHKFANAFRSKIRSGRKNVNEILARNERKHGIFSLVRASRYNGYRVERRGGGRKGEEGDSFEEIMWKIRRDIRRILPPYAPRSTGADNLALSAEWK